MYTRFVLIMHLVLLLRPTFIDTTLILVNEVDKIVTLSSVIVSVIATHNCSYYSVYKKPLQL